MKGLKWVLCCAVALAFVAAAGTAAARTNHTRIVQQAVGFAFGTFPCNPGLLPAVFTFQGIDDCAGRFTNIVNVCSTPMFPYQFSQITFTLTYHASGDTITGTMNDFTVDYLGDPMLCVRTTTPAMYWEITSGTGEFAGCTGSADGFFLGSSSECGLPFDDFQPQVFAGKIKFPGSAVCPISR